MNGAKALEIPKMFSFNMKSFLFHYCYIKLKGVETCFESRKYTVINCRFAHIVATIVTVNLKWPTVTADKVSLV